jgi:hypothetical protein
VRKSELTREKQRLLWEAEQMKVDVMDIFTDESAGKELTEAELAEREQRHEDYMLSLYLG